MASPEVAQRFRQLENQVSRMREEEIALRERMGRMWGSQGEVSDLRTLYETMYMPTPFGGGRRRWVWDACGPQMLTAAGLVGLTETSLSDVDYSATGHGAPCVSLDGANDYLSIADAAWQEAGANNLALAIWVNVSGLGALNCILAKDDIGANRSWLLSTASGSGVFSFGVWNSGLSTFVGANSTVAISTGVWYFIACQYVPSTRVRLYVGAATAAALTRNSTGTNIPASLADSGAAFAIGASSAGSFLFNGSIGMMCGWVGGPLNLDGWANYVFQHTKAAFI